MTQGEGSDQQTKPLRAFLAITFPPNIIRALTQVMKNMQTSLATKAVRWEKEENLHITLRFIGNMDPKNLEQLSANIQAQLKAIDPFTMTIGAASLFPSPKKPRVIAMVVEPLEKLQPLADALDRAVVNTGFTKADHPFRGHLTIARIKARRPHRIELPEISSSGDHGHLIETPVDQIALITSTTKPEGAVYRQLVRYEL